MKYDITLFPVSDDDKQLMDETGQPVNYRKLLIRICAAEVDGQGQPIRGEAKMQRYEIYSKLKKATTSIELDSEETSLLISAALAFPTIVAGQVRDYLNQKET